MHAQPTLSHELVDLFDQVNRQADEYVELFNVLRRKTRELDELRHEMQGHLTQFRTQSAEDARTARQAVELTLEDFGRRIEFVHEVHEDLESIRRLKTALVDLRMSFQKKTMELDSVVHSVQHFVKTEVESNFLTQDKNIDRKLKAVMTELSSFDTRLVNIQDLHRREFQQISEEVARIKGRIADTKYLVDDATKSIEEIVEAQTEKMNEKTRVLSEELDAKVTNSVTSLLNEGAFKDRVDHLRVEVNALDRKIRTFENNSGSKATMGMVLGGVGIVLALASFLFH